MKLNRRKFLCGMASTFAQSSPAEIRSRREWEVARERTLAGMEEAMGPLPAERKTPLNIVRHAVEETPQFTRTRITYLGEPGDPVPAWLLVPRNLRRRAPAMLCLHQTIRIGKDEPVGLGGSVNLHYAKELAERGFVCIAPDYPYLGENSFDPYKHGYASCTMKGIVNHMRAVDVLQSMREVDGKRIGAIGHSLGGHNALFVAAFDRRIRAMVTSCGFTSARKYYNGDLTGWSGVRYMPRIAERYGKDPARVPFDFPALLVALAPRPLFINAPLHDANFEVSGVRDCVAAALPVYERVFRAGDRLVARYPDAKHDFPPQIREEAWRFLARWV
ncbi:MAG: alpha/beta fold hydrolase [Blastocatellia bacterium]|nr:alpha/beta fold hydrolase [Blastocatellia bacterium]